MSDQNIFEELSVVELEERLELVSRCLCRVGRDTPAPAPSN